MTHVVHMFGRKWPGSPGSPRPSCIQRFPATHRRRECRRHGALLHRAHAIALATTATHRAVGPVLRCLWLGPACRRGTLRSSQDCTVIRQQLRCVSFLFINIGKSTINGPFSMAMLNNQRVTPWISNDMMPNWPGWWLTYPSEKWWSSSVGMVIPNIWKNNEK